MKITLTGAEHLDGEYELDLDDQPLNHYDSHIIKRIAGVRGRDIEDAWRALDSDMVVAIAVIALLRNGKIRKTEIDDATAIVYQVPIGGIGVIGDPDPEVEAALPPTSSSNGSESGGVNATSSGVTTSPPLDDPPVTTPVPTGPLESVISFPV